MSRTDIFPLGAQVDVLLAKVMMMIGTADVDRLHIRTRRLQTTPVLHEHSERIRTHYHHEQDIHSYTCSIETTESGRSDRRPE